MIFDIFRQFSGIFEYFGHILGKHPISSQKSKWMSKFSSNIHILGKHPILVKHIQIFVKNLNLSEKPKF